MSKTIKDVLVKFAIATHEVKPGEDESANFDEALAEITRLLEEAKPEKRSYSYYDETLPLYTIQSATNGYNSGTDDYHQNIKKILSHK